MKLDRHAEHDQDEELLLLLPITRLRYNQPPFNNIPLISPAAFCTAPHHLERGCTGASFPLMAPAITGTAHTERFCFETASTGLNHWVQG